jgi:hypothetical protein
VYFVRDRASALAIVRIGLSAFMRAVGVDVVVVVNLDGDGNVDGDVPL